MTKAVRAAAVHIAFFAILLHGLLPPGWMPSASGSPLVICTIHGAVDLSALLSGRATHKPAQDNEHQRDMCPFAAAPHFATPVAAVPVPISGLGLAHQPSAVALDIVTEPARYSPQIPRAPPQFA